MGDHTEPHAKLVIATDQNFNAIAVDNLGGESHGEVLATVTPESIGFGQRDVVVEQGECWRSVSHENRSFFNEERVFFCSQTFFCSG